jgi:DNA-binding transcriptional LysR family regulator
MKHLRTLTYIAEIARTGSIRRTAEKLNITPSALTRKLQDFEQELGTPVFERIAQGVRLNAAGELLVRHIRDQVSDFERVKSHIADLSGVRRGHVAIACSQAFVDHVLPQEIESYRARFPLVSFSVQVRDYHEAIVALSRHEADLALILQPPPATELHILTSCEQPLCALMSAGHPLAGAGSVRLRDCLRFPLAMPDHSVAIRHLLDTAIARMSLPADILIESNSLEFLRNQVLREQVVTFQVSSGIPAQPELVARPIDRRDMPPTTVVLAHLRGRTLPIAASKFADQLANTLIADRLSGSA